MKINPQFNKLVGNALPNNLKPNTFYFLENGNYAESYLTSDTGVPKLIGNSEMITDLAVGGVGGEISDINGLQGVLDNKQDKVSGKGLSENDFLTILKTAYDNAVSWITSNGTNLLNHLSNTSNPHSVTKAQVGLGSANNTSDVDKPVSTLQALADLAVLNSSNSYSDGLITSIKDGVATQGNTLQKLYNLILGISTEQTVANIAARDAFNIPFLPYNIFVLDDGDTRWALYKATSTGVGASFVKLSDPDLLNAVMSASQIKTAYESNSDTNALTNVLLSKLNAITGTNTGDESDTSIKSKLGITTLSGTNTGDQDLSNLVVKVSGKSLIDDAEIARLESISVNNFIQDTAPIVEPGLTYTWWDTSGGNLTLWVENGI